MRLKSCVPGKHDDARDYAHRGMFYAHSTTQVIKLLAEGVITTRFGIHWSSTSQ